MNFNRPLTLASNSPRRQQLLKEAGFKFIVRTAPIDEEYPDDIHYKDVAEYLARKKADAIPFQLDNEVIITSDTVVVLHGTILGKPKDKSHAVQMLSQLSGQTHDVITGVCLKSENKTITFSDTTNVTFNMLTSEEINFYIDNYKPFDKAGGYGIQEWLGMISINKIEGSYFTVMGLPIHRVYEVLKDF